MEKSTQKLIIGFVTLVIGLALLSQIAISGNSVTKQSSVSSESLNIAGARLYTLAGVAPIYNETLVAVDNITGVSLSKSTLTGVTCTVVIVTNATDGRTVAAGNYTATNCLIKTVSGTSYVSQNLNITYTYDYLTNNGKINVTYPIYIANVPTGWKSADCPVSDFTLKNQSGTLMASTTDYTFTTTSGEVLLKNTAALNSSASNATTVGYTYCGDTYLNSVWGRTAIELIPGFFAIALLISSVAIFYSIAKDEGIIA